MMQVGIDSYCFHRYFGEVYDGMQREPGVRWGVFDFLDYAESIGVDNVSLETCFLPSLGRPFLTDLKQRLDSGGFKRMLAWGHPSGLEAGASRDALEELRRHIALARQLEASVLRIVGSGGLPQNVSHEREMATLIEWLTDVSVTAAENGVKLAMENHNDFDSEEMVRIVEGVGSEHFGVNLDTGNLLRVFDDPVAGSRRLAPHTIAIHIKDIAVSRGSPREFAFWPSCPSGQGIVDLPAVVRALKDAGYQGPLTIEIDLVHADWAHLPEETIVRESVAYLRQVVADIG
jgi:sugar phosphate isomerase/epimerase